MGFLPSLGEAPHLYELMKKFPHFAVPTFRLHDVLMRGDKPFTVAERELIFAYVSGLNACSFCYRGHVVAAELWGVEPGLMDKIMADMEAAPISSKMRAILRFVKKLTETPGRMVKADADAVYAAGWDEEALFTAVGIAALTGFMNRVADGAGIVASNTKTTLKSKWNTYTENLINYGFKWPADEPPPRI